MNIKQAISLKTLQNARELGGYPADDKTVKKEVLLRSASLNGISEEDKRILRDEYRLSDIVDFRMGMELAGAADPEIDGVRYHHFDVIDIAAMGVEDMAAVDVSGFDLIQLAEISIQSGFVDDKMYIRFLSTDKGKKAYSEFFRVLLEAEPDRAVLWHCTNGKDRTGLGAMLLLSALGVNESIIIEDYLLTNEYFARRIAASRQYLKSKGCNDEFTEKALLVLDAVSEQYMSNAIAYLKKEYGSVIEYIRGGLNISKEEINSLKEKYLV